MVDVERVEVVLSPELAERIDWIVELLGFESRERYDEAVIREISTWKD